LAALDKENEHQKPFGINNYRHCKGIEEKDWVEVLKICPKAIQLIRKENQTDDMINAFFENVDIATLDKVHASINIARIKKEHVPYLIGSQIKFLQDIVARKMIKKARKDLSKEVRAITAPMVKQSETVGVDLTDPEYLDITKKFGQ
jgi:hypothetical protein